jgi:hypothetical protein
MTSYEEDRPIVEEGAQLTEHGGRVYRHADCGELTEVTGTEFARLANPFTSATAAHCGVCGRPVGLDVVYWADTGESVDAYRRRLREGVPRAFTESQCLVYGAAIVGLAVGLLGLVAGGRVLAGLLGMVIGVPAGLFLLAPILKGIPKKGLDYCRMK